MQASVEQDVALGVRLTCLDTLYKKLFTKSPPRSEIKHRKTLKIARVLYKTEDHHFVLCTTILLDAIPLQHPQTVIYQG